MVIPHVVLITDRNHAFSVAKAWQTNKQAMGAKLTPTIVILRTPLRSDAATDLLSACSEFFSDAPSKVSGDVGGAIPGHYWLLS